jgi:beta-lactamase class A
VKLRYSTLLAVLIVCAVAWNADSERTAAQTPPDTRFALHRLLAEPVASAGWFSPSFLAVVPLDQLQPVLDSLRQSLGEYRSLQGSGGDFTVHFDRGTLPASIAVNAAGQITSLLFGAPAFADAARAFDEAVAGLNRLPGQVALLVTTDGAERAAINRDAPLAVGSTFKLSVLLALRELVESGAGAWDDVVHLSDGARSLPSGILQDWPSGSPLTLQTLASLMISLSDNTATDALIDLVGRENVERHAYANAPLLKTRELFILKSAANADLLGRYLEGPTAVRRQVLAEAGRRQLPPASALQGGGTTSQVEWFYSVRQLCDLIEKVADLPAMQINPGLAEPRSWRRTAFKGGSEAGVYSLTHFLTAADGSRTCVSATWNHENAGEEQFAALMLGLIASLATQ